MIDMPYFMTNEEWYYFDYKSRKYMLTDKAPKKAKDSYEQYYKEVEHEYIV
jgi:hypothetical protein